VTLKLIQVYVTDKDGRPVRDLTKDDFIIYDAKKPVMVTDFEKHDLSLVPAAMPETTPKEQSPAQVRDINRKFIIFFDFAFNNAWGITAGVKAALDFLDKAVKPGDEVALLSYSMTKRLKIHEFLTTDIDKVRQAVSVISAKEIAGRADEIEASYWRLMESADEPFRRGDGNNGFVFMERAGDSLSRIEAENMRRDSANQAKYYFEGLTGLARAMRLVQGRKIVLFFSTGVPYSLVHQSRSTGGESTGWTSFDVGNSTLPTLQEAMLKEFSASDCSFYAFDTRESAKAVDLFGADRQSAGLPFRGSGAVAPFQNDRTTGIDTLKRMSRLTGGQYFSNIAFYEKTMEQVSDITGTYYVLGYSVASTWDGAFRDIKVEIKRKGMKVRNQAGYFNPKLFHEYTDLEKQLNLLDLALNEHSSLSAPAPLSVAALSYDAGAGTRLRAVARVPKDLLAGFQGKRVEFVAVFFNEQGNLLSLQRAGLDPGQYAGQDLVLTAGVPVRPGRVKCRIILRDLETGKSALGSADAVIVAPATGGLRLGTPLILVRRAGAGQIDGVLQGGAESPGWRDVYAFDPSQFTPMTGGDSLVGEGFVVAVPFALLGASNPDMVFKINLVNSETGVAVDVPFGPGLRTRVGNLGVQHLEIVPGAVPPGKYVLYVHAAEKSSGASASAHVPLTIEGLAKP
ncbi:MAG: VWA domain-containing protein, partial [Acidobacteriota bacterium]